MSHQTPMRAKRYLRAAGLATVLAGAPAVAQQRPSAPSAPALRQAVGDWRRAHEHAVMDELRTLVALPNLARDAAGIGRNAERLRLMLARRGFAVRLLDGAGGPPVVFGELAAPGARRTIVFYAHYDGQPVDSARWHGAPWTPVLRTAPVERGGQAVPWPAAGAPFDPSWRLFARSVSDDKSPIVAMLAAIDALTALGVPRSVNLKVFLEGEEEAGSPHVRQVLEREAATLRSDLWVFGDGPVHQSRRPQVVLGVRGTMGFQVTVYGPVRPLHSGHYGNWAPNPGVLLAQLIGSMRTADGRARIAGFYDDVRPATAAERAAIAAAPSVDAGLRAELGIAASEAGSAPLAERIMLPALNLQGLSMGQVGAGAANVIPTEATAAFGVRLVPEQRPARIAQLVRAHLEREGWHVVDAPPDSATRARYPRIARLTFGAGGYPAQRTPLASPAVQAVIRAVEPALDVPLIRVPTLGGSLPLFHFEEVLGAPIVTLPIVNHDNNQHGADENLRLQNLWDGIEMYAVLLARLGGEWER